MGTTRKPSLLAPFALGHFAVDCGPCAIWLIAPAAALVMDLTPADVGLLITIQSVGAAVVYLPAGLLADHASNRGRLLIGSFWWAAIGYAGASLAPGFWALAALLAFGNMGCAAWHPIATGVLVKEHPSRRAQVLGVHAMGGTFADVLAPLVVGFLLAHVDWRTALQLSLLPTVAMGIAFFYFARTVPVVQGGRLTRTDLADVWHTWRRPRGLKIVAFTSTYNMAVMAGLSMTPLYLQTVHGLSTVETGVAFSAMLLFGALAQPFVGRLSDVIGRRPIIILGNGLAALLGVGVWLGPPLAVVLVLLVVANGLLVAIRSTLLVAAVEHAGRREGTTLGLAFALMNGVGAVGAFLGGAVGTVALHHVYLLVAGFALVTLVIASTAGADERTRESGALPAGAGQASLAADVAAGPDMR